MKTDHRQSDAQAPRMFLLKHEDPPKKWKKKYGYYMVDDDGAIYIAGTLTGRSEMDLLLCAFCEWHPGKGSVLNWSCPMPKNSTAQSRCIRRVISGHCRHLKWQYINPLWNIHFEYERAPVDGTGDLGHWRYFAEISGLR